MARAVTRLSHGRSGSGQQEFGDSFSSSSFTRHQQYLVKVTSTIAFPNDTSDSGFYLCRLLYWSNDHSEWRQAEREYHLDATACNLVYSVDDRLVVYWDSQGGCFVPAEAVGVVIGVLDKDLEQEGYAIVSLWAGSVPVEVNEGIPIEADEVDTNVNITAWDWTMRPDGGPLQADTRVICVLIHGRWYVLGGTSTEVIPFELKEGLSPNDPDDDAGVDAYYLDPDSTCGNFTTTVGSTFTVCDFTHDHRSPGRDDMPGTEPKNRNGARGICAKFRNFDIRGIIAIQEQTRLCKGTLTETLLVTDAVGTFKTIRSMDDGLLPPAIVDDNSTMIAKNPRNESGDGGYAGDAGTVFVLALDGDAITQDEKHDGVLMEYRIIDGPCPHVDT